MKINGNKRLFILFIGLMLCVTGDLTAQDTPQPINKSQAAQKAQQKYQGRVLKVDQNKNKYRVKVLQKSGRVVSVDVDKTSGKVSNKTKREE
ncbi:MAG: putative membrane protein YkoI [Paraglaciecola sp.]